jgi:hypothetical protein
VLDLIEKAPDRDALMPSSSIANELTQQDEPAVRQDHPRKALELVNDRAYIAFQHMWHVPE